MSKKRPADDFPSEEETEQIEHADVVQYQASHYASAFQDLGTEREREAFRRGYTLAARLLGERSESSVMEILRKAEWRD